MKYLLLLPLVIFFACKNNQPPVSNQTNQSSQSANQQDQTYTMSKEEKAAQEAAIRDSTEMAQKQMNEAKNKGTALPDSVYRLVILFYSIGSGVENLLINEYVDSVGFYEQNIGKKIEYSKIHWGREGETDIVMRLNELNQAQQTAFIAMTRRVLSKGKYVNIYENYPWHRRGK